MKYALKDIAAVLKGEKSASSVPQDFFITEVAIDSRQIYRANTALFFALNGRAKKGISFIPELIHQGVQCFVIEEDTVVKEYDNAHFIRVKSPLRALQQLAAWHRHQYSLPVIGITGSNGKTIVKEWLHHLLQDEFDICRSPGSYNSQLGVPLSVLQLEEHHDLGIFEAGISERGEMHHLAPLIDCQIGVFTHLGDAHNSGFDSEEQKIIEKLQLFSKAEVVIYNRDVQSVDRAICSLDVESLTWGYSADADVVLNEIIHRQEDAVVKCTWGDREIEIFLPKKDTVTLENAMYCLLVIIRLKMIDQVDLGLFSTLPNVSMRLELLEGWDARLIINDTYNADMTSLKTALTFAREQAGPMRKYLVISEFIDIGLSIEQQHDNIVQLAQSFGFEAVILIGPYAVNHDIMGNPSMKLFYFDTLHAFEDSMYEILPSSSMVLLKGARKYGFERIAKMLNKPSAGTRLMIDLQHIQHNLSIYQSSLKEGTLLMVMIKASAYGAGFVEMARFLISQGVDYFGVAYISEGILLRKAGISKPIMVMNPEPKILDLLWEYDLEPQVFDFGQLDEIKGLCLLKNQNLRLHIKINSGMNRLGFDKKLIPDLIDRLKDTPALQIQSIFTHLSATDDPQKDEITRMQVEDYLGMYDQMCNALNIRPTRHVLNSSGIMAFEQFQFEMVRLGIGIYGLDMRTNKNHPLEVAHTFITYVAQVRRVDAYESIGYGARTVVETPRKVATISAGYADGIPRLAGNGHFKVKINGVLVPTIGNICMDMCMIDVSEIEEVERGDEVIVFGVEPPVIDLAEATQTIPYEIISGMSERVRRIFVYH